MKTRKESVVVVKRIEVNGQVYHRKLGWLARRMNAARADAALRKLREAETAEAVSAAADEVSALMMGLVRAHVVAIEEAGGEVRPLGEDDFDEVDADDVLIIGMDCARLAVEGAVVVLGAAGKQPVEVG